MTNSNAIAPLNIDEIDDTTHRFGIVAPASDHRNADGTYSGMAWTGDDEVERRSIHRQNLTKAEAIAFINETKDDFPKGFFALVALPLDRWIPVA